MHNWHINDKDQRIKYLTSKMGTLSGFYLQNILFDYDFILLVISFLY